MLELYIPPMEGWDELRTEFVQFKGQKLILEHSLVSLSKWESKWHKPFLTKDPMTPEETIDYIRCMTITQNVDPDTYRYLTSENIEQVKDYIQDPMTATTFRDELEKGGKGTKEQVTSELIYYWMVALQIPSKYEKWHLNRLITLIRVCNIKNQPPKKMSKRARISQYAALNEARKKQFNTTG